MHILLLSLLSATWRGAALATTAALLLCPPTHAQTVLPWTHATAIGGNQLRESIAVDAAGNCYVTGSFLDTAQVGDTTLTSVGGIDAYVARYGPTGQRHWVRHLGSPGTDSGYAVALDAAGNCYVTGYFQGTIELGNGLRLTSTSFAAKAYVVRYSPAGTAQWAQHSDDTSGSSSVTGTSLALDAAGSVVVAGAVNGVARFGTLQANAPVDSDNGAAVYLARFAAATGAIQSVARAFYYAAPHGPIVYQYNAPQLAVASTGQVYIGTYTNGQPVFDGPSPIRPVGRGSTDGLLACYSAAGTLQWVQQLGGPQLDRLSQVQTDAAGNAYVTGDFSGAATFGATTLVSVGSNTAYLAKYSPLGTLEWVRPGSGTTSAWSGPRFDAAGNVYTVGSFSGTASYGAFPLSSAGATDVVVASYTPQGQVRWAQSAGGSGVESGYGLGLDAQGSVYVYGRIRGTAAFGALRLSAAASGENFLARLGTAPLAAHALHLRALNFYPNPATERVTLPALAVGTRVRLLDALGRVVREAAVSSGAEVSVRGLVPGLYTLRATDAQGRQVAGRVVVE
ncbi:T9SS type A sorting domain-containing protein [Hymenobacter elongatus]|uniref:T9SS type A sorting domain-containing protein n=1 Tax=Hymenobacter elongatus TaxID=877208 RepID=A0A4Z0PP86_9BACT|nr:T9SS type A sorting domain-containing protein [Hymenobacter elongatus]TGE18946.1 T9SS type A sorting domain-containing protein [Hymenobacter elongatus]